MPVSKPQAVNVAAMRAYEIYPFRYARIPNLPGQVLLTSTVGEYCFLSERDFAAFAAGRLDSESEAYRILRTRQLLRDAGRPAFLDGVAAQHRTRKLFSVADTALHIFIVTLRCDHRCHYCQVSPRLVSESGFDMSPDTANAALDRVFESRERHLTIEFQGGEPALNFDCVRHTVREARLRANLTGQHVRFVITTTLHLFSDELLGYCRDEGIELSTSLDGPRGVHNGSRINPARDSYDRTVTAIRRAQQICGLDKVAALATVTRQSLSSAREIVDCYVALGFRAIALRPLSPFGFAAKCGTKLTYTTDEYLRFYRKALDYLIDLNLKGTAIEESYASLLLTRILTPFPTAYVDLQSPAAMGTGVMVYNYDGGVYVSDEGRMLAAMGDERFRMGTVADSRDQLLNAPAMKIVREAGCAEELPGCSECAFVPYCGADPVFQVATQGEPIGDIPNSLFCQRHTGYFRVLFEYLAGKDPQVMRVFLAWITRRDVAQIPHPGYLA